MKEAGREDRKCQAKGEEAGAGVNILSREPRAALSGTPRKSPGAFDERSSEGKRSSKRQIRRLVGRDTDEDVKARICFRG